MEKYEIDIEKININCYKEDFNFQTTEELPTSKEIIGQNRAVKSIDFGLNMKKKGYNIFLTGESGTGRNSYLQSVTREKAKKEESPSDWVYVYNFKKPDSPIALELPTGKARPFAKDIKKLINMLKKEITNAFFSKEYENDKNTLLDTYEENYDNIVEEINSIAESYGFMFNRVEEDRVVSVPTRRGKAMSEAQLNRLNPREIEEIKEKSGKLNVETVEMFNKLRVLREELDEKIGKLNKNTVNKLISSNMEEIKIRYPNEKVRKYLFNLEEDISENIESIKSTLEPTEGTIMDIVQGKGDGSFLDRYKVNIFLENKKNIGAPVIIERNPTYYNLLGAIEYTNEMGAMKTDFTKIKPGAIHQSNGGYLILQGKDLLNNPFSYSALKRALLTGTIEIETLERQLGYVVTSTLKPEAIPLDVKVVIVGDAYTYYALYEYDEDFRKLFKVLAEFDVEMERNKETVEKMTRFIATRCRLKELLHFSKEAVCKVIEYSSRLADDQNKLSSKFNSIVEIIDEASYWAESNNKTIVDELDVKEALNEKNYRNNMYEEKVLEMFKSEDYILDVDGEKVGEINGLAVIGIGEYIFGKPSKITVSTYAGKAGIINIEREAKTSGKIHDKGVMIISGYLGSKFAQKKPFGLIASVVFEQQYSGIDGDSASSTELYAILSSISGVAIKQNIAVTGSVNQRGEIQPIGGVNQKIEGFYKVCKLKGFTGKQGVMIPHQNVKNLMLDEEIKTSIKEGEFHIYSVKTIDEGIEVLTGKESGEIYKLIEEKLDI